MDFAAKVICIALACCALAVAGAFALAAFGG